MEIILDPNGGIPLYDANKGGIVLVATPKGTKKIKPNKPRVIIPKHDLTPNLVLQIAQTALKAQEMGCDYATMVWDEELKQMGFAAFVR